MFGERRDDECVQRHRVDLLTDAGVTSLSASLGACDMNGEEPLLERGERSRARAFSRP